MKKIILVFSLCLLLVSLSACGAAKKETSQPFSGSVVDLLKLGKSAKCVLVAKSDATISTGTTYISGNKARSDYEMTDPNGQKSTGHYISDGTWMYTWNDTYKEQAIKFKIDEMPKAEPQGQTGGASSSDLQDKMDYQCYPWVADQSMFNPPAGVNFMDYSQLFNQLQNKGQGTGVGAPSSGSDNKSFCVQCDNITNAAAKASCKKSLNCE